MYHHHACPPLLTTLQECLLVALLQTIRTCAVLLQTIPTYWHIHHLGPRPEMQMWMTLLQRGPWRPVVELHLEVSCGRLPQYSRTRPYDNIPRMERMLLRTCGLVTRRPWCQP